MVDNLVDPIAAEVQLQSMDAKHFLTSWTIWFGIAQIALGILGWISGMMDTQAAQAIIVTGIGTVGFRIRTTTAVTA